MNVLCYKYNSVNIVKTQLLYSGYRDRAGIHYFLQPHRHTPLLSHSVWLAAQSLAACTCGRTVNQIQTFHSSALLGDWTGLYSDLVDLFIGLEKSSRKEIAP